VIETVKSRSWCATSLLTDKNDRKYFVITGGTARNYSKHHIQIYDITNQNWLSLNSDSMEIENEGDDGIPFLTKPRWSHAACVIPSISNSTIYLFCGWDGSCQYSDVHKFKLSSKKIIPVSTTGKGPSYRGGLSATPYEKSVIIFGGACCKGGPYEYYNDVYIFDAEINDWTGPLDCNGKPPPPRSQHGAAIIDGNLIIVGGYNGTQLFNDVHVLNLETRTWKELKPNANSNWPYPVKGLEQTDYRVYPAGFAVVVLPSMKQLLVYGFVKSLNRNDACAYIFNLETQNWTRIDEFGLPPLQLSSGCMIDNNHIFIIGELDKNCQIINLALPTM